MNSTSPSLEAGQDRGEVAGVLDRRAAGDPQRGAHLGGDDHRQGGLAQAGRRRRAARGPAVAPRARARLEHQVELLADPLLADELVQRAAAAAPPRRPAPRRRRRRRRAGRRRRRRSVARSAVLAVASPGRTARSAGPAQRSAGPARSSAGRPRRRAAGRLGLRGDGGDRLVGLARSLAEADQGGVTWSRQPPADRRRPTAGAVARRARRAGP